MPCFPGSTGVRNKEMLTYQQHAAYNTGVALRAANLWIRKGTSCMKKLFVVVNLVMLAAILFARYRIYDPWRAWPEGGH